MTDNELMMIKVSENLEGYQELLEAVYEETKARSISVAIRSLKDCIKMLKRSGGLDELIIGSQATEIEVEELVNEFSEGTEYDTGLESGGLKTLDPETDEEADEEG